MANRNYENRGMMGDDRERWMGEYDNGYRSDFGRRQEGGAWHGGQGYASGRGYEDYGRREEMRGMGEPYGRSGREDWGRGMESGRDYGRFGEDWRRGQGFGMRGGQELGYGAREFVGRGYGERGFGERGFGERGFGDRAFGERGYGEEMGRFGSFGGYGEGSYRERDERGTFERLGDRMREGMRRMVGKPPKSYTRPDERIREDIYDRLMNTWVDAEEVEVQVKGGEVTLTGFVDGRQEKRHIEDLAEEVLGVKDVHNQIKVGRREGQPGTPGTQQRIARS